VWNTKNPFDFMEMISYVPSLKFRPVVVDFVEISDFSSLTPPPSFSFLPGLPRLDGKTNFFEKRVSDYKKANVGTGEHGQTPAKSAFR
jgi:hypothetical protein